MISAVTQLLGSVGGLATSYLDGKTTVQKAEAQIRMKEATGDIDWDLAAIRATQGSWKDESRHAGPLEAQILSLSIDKARDELGWRPRWNFETSVEQTITWYLDVIENRRSPNVVCREQLIKFQT